MLSYSWIRNNSNFIRLLCDGYVEFLGGAVYMLERVWYNVHQFYICWLKESLHLVVSLKTTALMNNHNDY